METLRKKQFMNPFFYNGRYVNNFIIYDPKRLCIIAETKRGWFGSGNNQYSTFDVPGLKLKRKVDLSSKQPFYVTSIDYCNEKGWDVYIPTNVIGTYVIYDNSSDFDADAQKTYFLIHKTFKFEGLFDDKTKVVTFDYDFKTIYTKYGEKVKEIVKFFKEHAYITTNEYDIDKLLKSEVKIELPE